MVANKTGNEREKFLSLRTAQVIHSAVAAWVAGGDDAVILPDWLVEAIEAPAEQ